MTLPLRRKWTLWVLVMYWPALFVLTHIPIPESMQKGGGTDKLLHFMAYFLLVFLFWGTVKPYEKVHWRRATVWWVLVVVVWYGVLDEWLQGFVRGRTMHVGDFFADVGAVVAGLLLLTFLTFWPALLGVVGSFVFLVFVYIPSDFFSDLPSSTILLPTFGFALFTAVWMGFLAKRHRDRLENTLTFWQALGPVANQTGRWCLLITIPPLALLSAVKLGTLARNLPFSLTDILIATLAILFTMTLGLIIGKVSSPTAHP